MLWGQDIGLREPPVRKGSVHLRDAASSLSCRYCSTSILQPPKALPVTAFIFELLELSAPFRELSDCH